MLTVFIQEVVLDVLAEEKLDCLTDLLPLLQNVLVILRMIPLGDSWERGEASWAQLQVNEITASKLARRARGQPEHAHYSIDADMRSDNLIRDEKQPIITQGMNLNTRINPQ